MKLAHVSDLHFGDAHPQLVAGLSGALADIRPDLIVATGDLTQAGRRREFAEAQAFFNALDAPVALAPGNHDTPMFNLLTRATKPFRRFGRYFPHLPRRDDGQLALRTLNTARGVQARMDWSLGHVPLSKARAAAQALNAAPAGAARVIACHHPLVTPQNAPMPARTRNGRAAAHVFAATGIDLVMTGHLHARFLEPLPAGDGKTWALGATTALSSRTRGEPVGFNLLEIKPDAFEVTWMIWRGGAFRPDGESRAERRA